MGAFCGWYEKKIRDLQEHEQEQCAENGQDCDECPDLIIEDPFLRQYGREDFEDD